MTETIRPITMPKWGLAMDEGTVVAWHVAEGVAVAAGDEILDIETTKITGAYESPRAGTLRRIAAAEGTTLPVGALIGVLADASVPDAEIDAFIERFHAEFAAAVEAGGEEAGPEPETVEVGGRTINHLRAGDGPGTPVVLVHGLGGDLGNWLFNQPALAAGRAVHALDLPGHGGSAKDVGAGDLAVLGAAVEGFLDALSIEKAHLVGHSLGGALCLDLAARAPGRAAGLTLIAPAGLGPDINGGYLADFLAAGRRKDMKAALGMLFADPALVSRDMVASMLRYRRLDGVDGALAAITGALFPGGRQAIDLRRALAGLDIPVQVIWGADDRIIPPAQAGGLPEAVAVHLLKGVGHMPHMEAAGKVNRLIEAIAG
jgi:pyruvate dehydrogenase E2 component (dihydrolipoamide acetyltransferase)